MANFLPMTMDTLNQNPRILLASVSCISLLLLSCLRRKLNAVHLKGPPASSLLFGVSNQIFRLMNPSSLYVAWSKLYGPVFRIPLAFGSHAFVIGDPKAIAAVLSRDTFIYSQSKFLRVFLRQNLGDNLLIAEGEDHKRQRRALSSGFSIAAIKRLIPVFFRSAHQVCDSWKRLMDLNNSSFAVVDVQHWSNAIALDAVGNGGFSHDFKATQGHISLLQENFDAFSHLKLTTTSTLILLLSTIFPTLVKVPTKRSRLVAELSGSMRAIAIDLIERARAKKQGSEHKGLDKSILGALIKSETASANVHMDVDEITAQIALLLLAGYDTAASSISWCLAELAQNPDIQQKLREELETMSGEDPTYDQLNSLPYLDAVVCETLRLHPAVPEVNRQANVDDILPLTCPIVDAEGRVIENLPIPAGTNLIVPLGAININEDFWGENSRLFNPSRWTDDGDSRKQTEIISGFRHLLTFSHGSRVCLGRLFALTEFKVALAVLIREYSFEFENPNTKVVLYRALSPRPGVEGGTGPFLPMVVRRIKY